MAALAGHRVEATLEILPLHGPTPTRLERLLTDAQKYNVPERLTQPLKLLSQGFSFFPTIFMRNNRHLVAAVLQTRNLLVQSRTPPRRIAHAVRRQPSTPRMPHACGHLLVIRDLAEAV